MYVSLPEFLDFILNSLSPPEDIIDKKKKKVDRNSFVQHSKHALVLLKISLEQEVGKNLALHNLL